MEFHSQMMMNNLKSPPTFEELMAKIKAKKEKEEALNELETGLEHL